MLRSLLDHPTVRKLFRYSMASVVGVVTGQAILFLCSQVLDWEAWVSNVVSVTISSIPAYIANRYWVWNKRGKNSLLTEVVPFWLMALLGLALSTILVAIVDNRTDAYLAIAAANLGGFGVLWVAKFLILDRLLFKPVAEAVVEELEERHLVHLDDDEPSRIL